MRVLAFLLLPEWFFLRWLLRPRPRRPVRIDHGCDVSAFLADVERHPPR